MRKVWVAAAALAMTGCATAPVPVTAPPRWAAQLYTVRDAMAADPIATLRRVDALGYDAVEYAGIFGRAPAGLCAETRALGLTVVSAHADWKLLRDNPQAALAEAKALCTDTLVLAWLPLEERQTLAQWRWWVEHLNAVAELARAQGLRVAYHNHEFEFAAIDGVRPIDLLMAGLAPEIGFELDIYWTAHAGVAPLDFLRAHRGRITHLHLKDRAADGSMADLGAGTLPLDAIIAEARAQGVRHLVVERDDAPDPFASLAASLDTLAAMPFQPR